MSDTSSSAQESALIVIPETDIMTAFTGEFSAYFEPRLVKLKERVAEFQKTDRDATKKDDREDIKAFARKLVKTRTTIDGHGKVLADRLKALPKKNDENRRLVRVAIEGLEADVLRPVNAWEAKEKARIDGHLSTLQDIAKLANVSPASTLDDIMFYMRCVEELAPIGDARGEFAAEYERVQRIALDNLGKALVARRQYDADQAELAGHRKRQAEQAAKDKQEAVAREVVAREQRERDAEARRATERAEAAEREALAQRQRAEAEATAKVEAEARRRAEEAQRRLQAEADARRAEDDRIAREKAESERKALNTRYRTNVNRVAEEAMKNFLTGHVTGPLAAQLAPLIIDAIAKDKVPCVSLNY